MTAFWAEPDFDAHELVQLVHDRASGLTAIIAVHSTHLGPSAGGTRFWHYNDPAGAMRDALRLSRGMSYKNAMAGLPMGGGKAVILADEQRIKTPEMLAAFGDAVEGLGGRYVTAEDVGITEADMVAVSQRTAHVSGLPVAGEGSAGGDPGPFTAYGIYLGIKAAVRSRFPWLQVTRGLLLVTEVCVMVVAFVQLGLVESHAVFTSYPLLVAALFLPLRINGLL